MFYWTSVYSTSAFSFTKKICSSTQITGFRSRFRSHVPDLAKDPDSPLNKMSLLSGVNKN
jgi:hypothetical protein